MTELSETACGAIATGMHAIIGEISEQNYAAGWMDGIEFEVWRDTQATETGAFDRGYLTQLQALRELNTLIDGWVDYHGYVPMAEWQKRLAARSERTADGCWTAGRGTSSPSRRGRQPVPAGDAGRPYGTPAEENAWDVANELRTENDRLRAQLAAQQAVVDVARALRDCALRQHGDCEHTQAVADALDKAQAAQPEGERAR